MLKDITNGEIRRMTYNNVSETLKIVYANGITKEITKLPANEYNELLEAKDGDFVEKVKALGAKYGIRTLIED